MKLGVIFSLVLAMALAVEPGYVFNAEIDFMKAFVHQSFDKVMEQFDDFPIPDMQSGPISSMDTKVTVHNDSPDNVIMNFDVESNSLYLEIKNTHVHTDLKWRFKKGVLKFHGTASAKGPITTVSMNIAFKTQ